MSNDVNIQSQFKYDDGVVNEIILPVIKKIVESSLNIELKHYLANTVNKNRKNGYTKKKVKSSFGTFALSSPRDRNGKFKPVFIKKNQTNLILNGRDKHIVYMLASDISRSYIKSYVSKIYGSEDTIVDKISDLITKVNNYLQSRELSANYSFIWINTINYTDKNNPDKNITCYAILGLSTDEKKELIGVYSNRCTKKDFWKDVITDFKNRGMQNIFIACLDNVDGMSEVVSEVFPNVELKTTSTV